MAHYKTDTKILSKLDRFSNFVQKKAFDTSISRKVQIGMSPKCIDLDIEIPG